MVVENNVQVIVGRWVILDAKCGRKFHNKIYKGAHCGAVGQTLFRTEGKIYVRNRIWPRETSSASAATKEGVELSGQRVRRVR